MHPFGGRLDEEVADEVTAVLAWSEKAYGWSATCFLTRLFQSIQRLTCPSPCLWVGLQVGVLSSRSPMKEVPTTFLLKALCPVGHN